MASLLQNLFTISLVSFALVACSDIESTTAVKEGSPVAPTVRPASEVEVRRVLVESDLYPFSFRADGTFVFQSTGPQLGTYTVDGNRLCITRPLNNRNQTTRCRDVSIGPDGVLFLNVEHPELEPAPLPM
jgi:hypothetical protein